MDERTEKVDFSGLVAGLAASAFALLSQVQTLFEATEAETGAAQEPTESVTPDEKQRRISDGLGGARRMIDTLAVLEAKTQGNLTVEERELLMDALSELRIRFVNVSSRAGSSERGVGG